MAFDNERQRRGDRDVDGIVDWILRPDSSTRFRRLTAPVGIRVGGSQAVNHVNDQQVVMQMLDQLRVVDGGNRRPDGSLEVWWPVATEGRCNAVLWSIIIRVQNTFHSRGWLKVPPDGVIDPDGTTQRLIRNLVGDGPPPMPASDPKEIAKTAVPLALRWAQGALVYLQLYKQWRNADCSSRFDATAANVHLHLDRLSKIECMPRIDEWLENYRLISAALRNADKVFVRATREEALAARNRMKCWGVSTPAWASEKTNIWFGPEFLGLGPNCRAAILLHEGGHYIRKKIDHQGGERGLEYDNQSADQALTSAYVCPNFATHATTGRDERFGLARPAM